MNVGVQTKDLKTIRVGNIQGASFAKAGFLVYSNRGTEKIEQVNSFNEFERKFGSYNTNYFGAYCVEGFFNELNGEPGVAFIKRMIPSDSVVSSLVVKNTTGTNAWKFWAGRKGLKDPGIHGDNYGVEIVDDSSTSNLLTVAVALGDTTLSVDNVSNFKIYDFIDVGGVYQTQVIGIDEMNNVLAVSDPGVVTAIGAIVSTITKTVKIYKKDPVTSIKTLMEVYPNTSSDYRHVNFIVDLINNDEVGSEYVYLENLITPEDNTIGDLPVATALTFLTGGLNGTSLTSNQMTALLPSFDYEEINFLVNCESFVDSIYDGIEKYCAARNNCRGIVTVPFGSSEDSCILWAQKKRFSKEIYCLAYYDWIKVDDPIGYGLVPQKDIPVLGHIVGHILRIISLRGVHHVPADPNTTFVSIRKLSNELKDIKKITMFGELGLNCISENQGIFWVRTGRSLSKAKEYTFINASLMKDYFKLSFKDLVKNYENATNRPELLQTMVSALNAFAEEFKSVSSNGGGEGGFYPYNASGVPATLADVWRCVIDEPVNTLEKLKAGELHIECYFAAPNPIEKIEVGVGMIYYV